MHGVTETAENTVVCPQMLLHPQAAATAHCSVSTTSAGHMSPVGARGACTTPLAALTPPTTLAPTAAAAGTLPPRTRCNSLSSSRTPASCTFSRSAALGHPAATSASSFQLRTGSRTASCGGGANPNTPTSTTLRGALTSSSTSTTISTTSTAHRRTGSPSLTAVQPLAAYHAHPPAYEWNSWDPHTHGEDDEDLLRGASSPLNPQPPAPPPQPLAPRPQTTLQAPPQVSARAAAALTSQIQECTDWHAVEALYRTSIAAAGAAGPSRTLGGQQLVAMLRHLARLPHQKVSYAKYEDNRLQRFCTELADAVLPYLPELDAVEQAQVLWAFGKLDTHPGHAFLEQEPHGLLPLMQLQLRRCGPTTLSQALSGLARIGEVGLRSFFLNVCLPGSSAGCDLHRL